MIQLIAKHLIKTGGSALIGDYGYSSEKADTFRVCSDFSRSLVWNFL